MKRNVSFLFILGLLPMLLTGCNNSSTSQEPSSSENESSLESEVISSEDIPESISISASEEKLDKVTGFSFEDGILSFTPVTGATAYEFTFTHNGEVVFSDTMDITSVDVDALGLQGSNTLTVVAKNGTRRSEEATYDFIVLSVFEDVIFEAENFLYNFGTGKSNSNFRNNPLASNGAYVGGLDDAGHGIYINYLCPFDGEYEIESHYCYQQTSQGITKAHHDIWVNGAYDATFEYTENTGWGGATFDPAVTKTNIHLKKGWNTISIMKNGDSSDNWGDFAEIDYLVLKGTNEKYDMDELVSSYGERPAKYRLEAEMGSPRKKFPSGLYQCKNPCIVEDETHKYSNGFLMGGVEKVYDGVEWHVGSPIAARYKVELSYAAGMFEGCKPAKPAFIVTQEAIGLQKNVDFLDHKIQQMDALPYTGWNVPTVAEQTFEIELSEGDNFIYCIVLNDSGYFQIDYCDLTFIAEL